MVISMTKKSGAKCSNNKKYIYLRLSETLTIVSNALKIVEKVAGVTGLEPAASGVTGRRSNQLSYTP